MMMFNFLAHLEQYIKNDSYNFWTSSFTVQSKIVLLTVYNLCFILWHHPNNIVFVFEQKHSEDMRGKETWDRKKN